MTIRLEPWRSTQRPARDHCMAPGRTAGAPPGAHRYTRMFPDLPHLSIGPDVLHALRPAGGACDTRYSTPNESNGAAGWPRVGQVVAHDLTADPPPGDHHPES